MPISMYKKLNEKGDIINNQKLEVPKKFDLAVSKDKSGNRIFAECDREIVTNVKLRIRHGSSLFLRNVKWYVSLQDAD